MIRKIGAIALLGFGAAVYFAGGEDSPTASRVGYFKSEGNDRVMAYQATGPMSDLEARAVLRRVPSTPGAVTIAVLYEPDVVAPSDKLTLAPDFAAAARMVGEAPYSGWAARMRINPAGRQTFD